MRRILSWGLWLSVVVGSYAQTRFFDPLLDPDVSVEKQQDYEEWRSCYMWYPGQLAAFCQQQCVRQSKERCVNVGYPGKFFALCKQAYFRKVVTLEQPCRIRWEGPVNIKLYVNGHFQHVENRRVMLPKGKSLLLFEVSTQGDSLPCLLVEGGGLEHLDGWQVSMDREHWVMPESNARYRSPKIRPDARQELSASMKPIQMLPLRNTQVRTSDGVSIGKNGYALVDFFHLELGTLVFRAKGKGRLFVRVGETPEEALERDDKKLEQYPLPPVELSDDVVEVCLPERALRYAALECDGKAVVDSIRFEASVWPVDFQMQFETDDDYVNNLFQMSRATLHTSMHQFYLDGVKRDFLPWSMDALVSVLAGDYLFGDQQVAKNGISIGLMPLHPRKSDIGIPDYPLHALFGLKQNYLRYGDLSTSLQYKDRIVELLDFYASIVDENGFVHGNYGDRQFGYTPGWSTYNGPARKGIAAYAQMMLYYNYQTGAYFARLWHDTDLARKYDKLAQDLKEKIFERFWDNERKAFINGTMNDGVTVDGRISHHAQYWAILSGLFPEEYYDNLFENILPSLPRYYEVVSYEKGYEFLAYAKAGRVKELWDYIYRVFGDWMEQGHTRFPENFMPYASRERQLVFYNRPYGLSLCHGANGVPVVVGALNGIIGFSQSEQRPEEYTLSPELLHLKWVRARIPIKEGYIYMELRAEGESMIEIPDGCRVKIVLKGQNKPVVLKKAGKHVLKLA